MKNPIASSTSPAARRTLPTLLALTGALCTCALLGACNIAGPVIAVMAGPTGNSAMYTLPKDRTAVVFIDDRASRIPTRTAREMIGVTAENALLKRGVVKDMIQSRLVLATLRTERFGEPMTIAEVGRAVQADIVIYATVKTWTLSPDGQTFAPEADLLVKVVDAHTDERLWPPGDPDLPKGYVPLTVHVREQARAAPTTSTAIAAAQNDLASWVGLRLAQMFYDHAPEEEPVKLKSEDLSRE